MHYTLLICLSLLLLVSLIATLGQKLRIAYPILLVLGGLAISYLPGVPAVAIDPDLIFLIFLPPLLYEAAWFTSWKDFWKWKRVIGTFAFILVILTACVVAVVCHAMIPGFTLALGFLLGGIISPPDAVAATSVLKSVSVPRRLIAILEGESLINDASGLIVFRFAMAAIISGSFMWHEAVGSFFLVTIVGVLVGIGVAFIFYAIHRWVPVTPSVNTVLTLLAPYIMYALAEEIHVSGVMAVVSGGLFMSSRSHFIFSSASRMQGENTWATVGFVLNGLVFILIGLQLPSIVDGLNGYSKTEAIAYGLLVTATIIITRIAVALGTSAFTVFISRYIRTNDPKPGWRGPFALGWAGMRGVVSLAAALSIPVMMEDGTPFPQRNLILFITFVVILVTLVLQGLSLPVVIKALKLPNWDNEASEHEQEAAIRLKLSDAAIAHISQKHAEAAANNRWVSNLLQQLENDSLLSHQKMEENACTPNDVKALEEYDTISKEILSLQRKVLAGFRRHEAYNNELIHKHEVQMDLKEEYLSLRSNWGLSSKH